MLRTVLSAFLGCALAGSLATAGEVTFTKKPEAVQDGEKLKITFAVSAPADVEVAVLDKGGKVVRHLAAGMLGAAKPPPAPLKTGLEQSLEWDGKNDLGEKAGGGLGDFTVRVRAGMGVKFGRIIGASPYTGGITSIPYRAPLNGLAADADGNLYVKMMSAIGCHGNRGLWPWHVRKFDKKGEYVKTLLPYAASTPPEKTPGFNLVATGDGFLAPGSQTTLYSVYYEFGNEILPRVVDGSLVFVHTEARRLVFFKLDGSNAVKVVPMWPKTQVNCPNWLDIQAAISPDGKYAYYSNAAGTAYDGKQPSDIDPKWPQGRIYRQDLTAAGSSAERFFDLELPDFAKQKYWMPSAWDKKTQAAGIAVDAKGNVLIGDLVNMEVVEISPEGKKLSATKVQWPDKVMVSRKTGDLYVISQAVSRGFLPPATLYKFTGRGADAKVAAEMKLGAGSTAHTLDESADAPALYIASHGQVMRIEDRDGKFTVTNTNLINRDPKAIGFVGYMDVDAEAELVYIMQAGVYRFNGETGEGGYVKEIRAVDLAVGPGGMVYTWGTEGGYQGPVARYTRELKPAPLAATGKNTYGDLYGRAGRGSNVCGIDVDAQGRVYAVWGSNDCHVRVHEPDGSLKDYPRKLGGAVGAIPVAIDGVSGWGGSIRVDLAGNMYLVQRGVPKGFVPPKGFEKDEAYRTGTGSILKFSPAGGERSKEKDAVLGFSGVLKVYPDCGPNSEWNCDGSCVCTKPRFDVDGFGRLYVPNAFTFSISVRDNEGNEILRFGRYANFDSQGPASAEPKPEIPLGWPTCAGATDRFIYVGDTLNHRVVRVDKVWAAEEKAPVK